MPKRQTVSQSKTAGKRQSSILVLNRKNFLVAGGLVVLTWGLIFYVGYSLGRSTLSPDRFNQVVKVLEPSESPKEREEDFAVLQLGSNPAPPSGFAEKVDGISRELEKENGAVSNPQPPVTTRSPSKAKAGKFYAVQIAAISDLKRANSYVRLLREKNFDAYLQTISDENNAPMYRVRVGKSSFAEAEAVMEKLKPLLEGIRPTIFEVDP